MDRKKRLFGFLLSLLFTLVAYFIILSPASFKLDHFKATISIIALGIVQAAFQLIFFLDLAREKRPRWNLIVFASTLSIIVIVIVGTLWIMHHLNYNMKM